MLAIIYSARGAMQAAKEEKASMALSRCEP